MKWISNKRALGTVLHSGITIREIAFNRGSRGFRWAGQVLRMNTDCDMGKLNRGFTRINTDFVGKMMEHVHAGTAGAGYNALPTQLAAGHQTIL